MNYCIYKHIVYTWWKFDSETPSQNFANIQSCSFIMWCPYWIFGTWSLINLNGYGHKMTKLVDIEQCKRCSTVTDVSFIIVYIIRYFVSHVFKYRTAITLSTYEYLKVSQIDMSILLKKSRDLYSYYIYRKQ